MDKGNWKFLLAEISVVNHAGNLPGGPKGALPPPAPKLTPVGLN